MDTKKAQKAVRMAEMAMDLMDLEDEMAEAQEADLQPEDGYINPMGRIGTVPPSTYSLGNMRNGTKKSRLGTVEIIVTICIVLYLLEIKSGSNVSSINQIGYHCANPLPNIFTNKGAATTIGINRFGK